MAGKLIEKVFQVGHIEDYNDMCPDGKGVYYVFAKGKEHGNMGRIENMMGVPLTSEILEKNGFVRSKVFVEWKYERNGNYLLWKPFPWLQISTDNSDVNFECKYVHELQHALRLCGLTESADNFKV